MEKEEPGEWEGVARFIGCASFDGTPSLSWVFVGEQNAWHLLIYASFKDLIKRASAT